MMMSRPISRGVAAALLLSGVSLHARAQSGGGVVVRSRDSIVVRRLQGEIGRLDSVMAIVNQLQREPMGSNEWSELRARLDSLLPAMTARVRMAAPAQVLPKGWIGINVGGVPMREQITSAGDMIRYLVHPDVISVDPDSPAFRAGIAPGDVLVAYNGLDVVEHDVNLTQLLVPEKRMLVTVRRDGETRDFNVTIAQAPEHVYQRRLEFDAIGPRSPHGGQIRVEGTQDGPNVVILPGRVNGMPGERLPIAGGQMNYFFVSPDGIFGARVSVVTADLARALKLDQGVLLNDVPDDSPAAKSGLRTGDVITGANGQPINSILELQRFVSTHMTTRVADLQIVRDKKSRKITVHW